jgi:hypothetical protein
MHKQVTITAGASRITISSRFAAVILFAASLALFAASLAGCAPNSTTSALSSGDQAKLASLPAGMATVVQSEPASEQREFLDLPDAERGAVVSQWSNRAQVTTRFTPAERMLISILSREESDHFFALPAGEQEGYLVKVVERDASALRSCMTATHRRLGEAP